MARRKALKTIWSLRSIQSLKDIYIWYAEDYSVSRAKKVVLSIRSKVRQIVKIPFGYPMFPYTHPQDESVRYAIVKGTYWIIYEVTENQQEVIDIIHASQNPELFKVASSDVT